VSKPQINQKFEGKRGSDADVPVDEERPQKNQT